MADPRINNASVGAYVDDQTNVVGLSKGHGDAPNVNASATSAVAVTPSDVTTLTFKSLYIGVDGSVAVRHRDGTIVTYANALGGSILPVAGDQVLATGTTATSIVAMNW